MHLKVVSRSFLGNALLMAGALVLLSAATPRASAQIPSVDNGQGASAIATNSATLNGNLTSTGGAPTMVRLSWGLADGGTSLSAWANTVSLGIRAKGAFSTNLSGLISGRIYYYRCSASNLSGPAWAPTTTNFTTLSNLVSLPVINNATGATAITTNTATLNGNLTSTGGAPTTVRISWGLTNGGTSQSAWANTVNRGIRANGLVSSNVSGLIPGRTYFYRCSASNQAGLTWAPTTTNFMTSSNLVSLPVINNAGGASNITTTSADLNGTLMSTGGAPTSVYVCWGPVDGGTHVSDWSKKSNLGIRATGAFSTLVSGLTPFAMYYYRCWASNVAGMAWAPTTARFMTGVATNSPTHYVAAGNPAAQPPFTNWATAASNIQDAVDVASEGDTVLVTNGNYIVGRRNGYPAGSLAMNRVAIWKAVTVKSVNGNGQTLISGQGPAGTDAVRCVYLASGAVLDGFTLRSGFTQNSGNAITDESGGGAWCDTNAVLIHCIITGNSAISGAGGIYGGRVVDCLISNNLTSITGGFGGGGAWKTTLIHCTLVSNRGIQFGGGRECLLSNCVVRANLATLSIGGIGNSTAWDTLIQNNMGGTASYSYGGGAAWGILYNCLVVGNTAGGVAGGVFGSSLYNCTVVSNKASASAGGVRQVYASAPIVNCIIYDNSALAHPNWDVIDQRTNILFCCTTPSPGDPNSTTDSPMFVDPALGNYHLQSKSPCIDAGSNQGWMTGAKDMDGAPRIINGRVNMGAFEDK